MTYTLLGSQISYFTGKARAYLRWKGVPFREELATRDVYKSIILPRVGWAVVPVLITPDGETVQDTSDIIDHVEAAEGGPSVYPDGAVQKLVALLFELYGDEWLVIPAMHYRWHYNERWAYGAFGEMSVPERPAKERRAMGERLAQRFKGFTPILGVSDATIPGVEAAYEDFLADFSAHLETQEFLLGDRPSIGDYGLIGPLYAHLYRDPFSGKIMERVAPAVARWVERCHAPQEALSGSFLPRDQIPETVLPMLKRQMTEQLPSLMATSAHLSEWLSEADRAPGDQIPRGLGMHEFSTGGRQGERASISFSLWMLQRVLDHYNSLDEMDRAAADGFLDEVGGGALKDFTLPCRLGRRDFRLCVAE